MFCLFPSSSFTTFLYRDSNTRPIETHHHANQSHTSLCMCILSHEGLGNPGKPAVRHNSFDTPNSLEYIGLTPALPVMEFIMCQLMLPGFQPTPSLLRRSPDSHLEVSAPNTRVPNALFKAPTTSHALAQPWPAMWLTLPFKT
jgi:hypothetical protein